MKKNAINSEKGNGPKAFLPEMILNHLNNAKPTEINNTSTDEVQSPQQAIVFDPLADPFDGLTIDVKPSKKKQNKIY
ncbi:hypothetical protein [Flavobacterium adhaerens]|uniref:hypothetical protein n=1 Tax=Flavobacterium adhaerens TaxID=3149043 RepID=UPI0032B3666A